MVQFNPPPDLLVKEYLDRESPYQTASNFIGSAVDSVAQYDIAKRCQQHLAMQDALLKQKAEQDNTLRNTEMANRSREMFYNYGDPSYLPKEVQSELNSPSPTDGAPAQMSPMSARFSEFLKKYPQGLKGAQVGSKAYQTGLSTEYTPEEAQAILQGQLPGNKPVSERTIGRVLAARGQTGTQGRFDTRLNQSIVEKGAKATMDTGKEVKPFQEARNALKSLQQEHGRIVRSGMAGDPVTSGFYGIVSKATGGKFGTQDVLAYQKVATGMAGRLKAITGNVGMLTEFDQQRLEDLIPQLGEGTEVVKKKIEQIDTILGLAEKGQMERLDLYLKDIGIKTQDSGPAGQSGSDPMGIL